MIFWAAWPPVGMLKPMPRPPRITEPGLAYHILSRRVLRLPILKKDREYAASCNDLAEPWSWTAAEGLGESS